LTSTDPDEGDETGKVGAMGIPATEIPFPYTTNDVVAKQLKELISQGLVEIKGEGEPPNIQRGTQEQKGQMQSKEQWRKRYQHARHASG
jgi:hypothetical protein